MSLLFVVSIRKGEDASKEVKYLGVIVNDEFFLDSQNNWTKKVFKESNNDICWSGGCHCFIVAVNNSLKNQFKANVLRSFVANNFEHRLDFTLKFFISDNNHTLDELLILVGTQKLREKRNLGKGSFKQSVDERFSEEVLIWLFNSLKCQHQLFKVPM